MKKAFISLILPFFVFLICFLLELDFGAFKRDYYEAHSLGMDHLHSGNNLVKLIYSIPNSASGVLPLYIYGFFKGYYLRKYVSLFFLGLFFFFYL